MTDVQEQVDVLVVGAGPSGLALTLALRRLGVEALLVDRAGAGANTSGAAVIHARTLEVLDLLGVTPDLLARGLRVPTFRVRDRDRILAQVNFEGIDSPYPFTLMLPQDQTEAVLLHHLEACGGHVDRPVEMISAKADRDGAVVLLRDRVGERTVRAGWLVGCDGGRSRVRSSAGIGFVGGEYQETFVLADVIMDEAPPRDGVDLLLSRKGLVVIAPLPADRSRIVATVAEEPADVDAAFLEAILAERGPRRSAGVREVIWTSRFHLHHRIAETPRRGRILLCGDAAHVHSPAGGQGMNTGIQDAVSLASVLADVLDGGDDAVLTAWASRRHDVARDVVAFTDRLTRLATMRSRAGRNVRNALLPILAALPAVGRRAASRLAGLDRR